jgi:hypothetical protein
MSTIRRATYQPPRVAEPRFIVRWDRIVGGIATGVILAVIIIGSYTLGEYRAATVSCATTCEERR